MAMSKTAPIFEIYTDRKGEFRWRARARNGNLLAAASEGYTAKRDAVHCAKLFGYDPTVLPPVPKQVVARKAPVKAGVKAPVKAGAKAPVKAGAKAPAKKAPAAKAPEAAAAKPKRAAKPVAVKPVAAKPAAD